jgi:CheY-like chemotaxis protein
MNETNQKIMVIEQREAAKRALKEMLSPLGEVTFVDSGAEAEKKAKDEDFDLIVTNCILPRLAGKEGVLIFKTGDAKVSDEKTALLEKVRDTVHRFETDFKSKVSESEELLAQSQIQQEKISELINERLRRLEEDKIQHSREIEGMEHEKQTALNAAEEAARMLQTVQKESEIALAAKGETEKQLEAALVDKTDAAARLAAALEERAEAEQRLAALVESSKADSDALNMTINTLKENLDKSAAAVEAMIAEKTMVEEKLARIQEQWEKFAGNQ